MSVRVIARIRPLLKLELDKDTIVTAENSGVETPASLTVVRIPNPKNDSESFSFQFNAVYDQQATQHDEQSHEVARVAAVKPLSIATNEFLRCSAHGWRNDVACRVHEDIGEVFEYALDVLFFWFAEIFDCARDTDLGHAEGELGVGLSLSSC